MSVEKRPNADGTQGWRVRWRDGERNRSRTFRTRRDADLFDADLVRCRRLGSLGALDAGKLTLDTFVTDSWAPHRAAGLEVATQVGYAWLYRAHIGPEFADVPMREITPQRIAAWQSTKVKNGAGRKAIKEAKSLLGGILGYAVELEHLQFNAARAVRPVKQLPRKTGRGLSAREVEALRAALDEPWRVLVSLIAYSGVRPGEAVALRWADIGDTIRVERAVALIDGSGKDTKNHKARNVRLLAPLATDLAAWRLRCGRPGPAALVFPHPSGRLWTKPLWDNWRRRQFTAARTDAEIGALRPYDLRHTFASLLLAEGRTLHYVAAQIGDSVTQIEGTYGHVIAEYAERVRIDAEVEIRMARGLVYPSSTREAGAEPDANTA